MNLKRLLINLFTAVFLVLHLTAFAAETTQAPNWNRELALQTARSGLDEQQLLSWFEWLRNGEQVRLLEAVESYGADRSVSSPVREQHLLLFTRALADFPLDEVPEPVLEYLEDYSPQTLVPHEESSNAAVPLFNISAAAQGVRNSASRQQAEGLSLALSGEAEIWIRAFKSASPEERRGFIDAINTQPLAPMEMLGQQALASVVSEPGLTAVAGSVALRAGDLEAIQALLISGSGPDLAPILRESAAALPINEQAQMLLSVVQEAPAENAALSIALLAPGLQHIPEITDTLFDLLADEKLGAAAALALSKYPAEEVKARITFLAETGLAGSQRARMAISLMQNDRSRGVNP